ncbi:MAG: class I SAM-dependent methyltransferase [Nitrospirae bacterium]|nr:class I SAM-dependent methyltransferase [Nitrospirota bacterium]
MPVSVMEIITEVKPESNRRYRVTHSSGRSLRLNRVSQESSSSSQYVYKDFSGSSHRLVLNAVRAMPPRLRICDVGCGDGYLSRELRSQAHYVVGLDSRPPTPGHEAWDRFYESDLAAHPTRSLEGEPPFDLILMADILEHLPEPEATLRDFLRTLKPGGRLIISVPNVANLYVRLHLLTGRFEYQDRGILDRGHLRFFTQATFLRMLAACGLQVEHFWGSVIPWPLIWPRFFARNRFDWINRLLYVLTQAWINLLAYQFVAQVKLGNSESF